MQNMVLKKDKKSINTEVAENAEGGDDKMNYLFNHYATQDY
jgi:hypothetical protein